MENRKRRILLLTVVFVVSVVLNLFSGSEVAAQEEKKSQEVVQEGETRKTYEVETLTVTAEKREENIQEIPVSITALSATQIEDSGITSIKDFSLQIPNLNIAKMGDRYISFVYTRGIGAAFNEPAMGFYVDDVNYLHSETFDTELFDIERIEVLRGPQGTLYGRNTLGGVINIITKKPKNHIEGTSYMAFGDYGRRDYRLALRGPVIRDKLFLGISGMKSTRDGYDDNDYLGTDVADMDRTSGRAFLRWRPNDSWDITLSVNGEGSRDDGNFMAPLNEVRNHPNHVSQDYEGYADSDTNGQSLRATYESPRLRLTSITARRDWEFDCTSDMDFTPMDIARGPCIRDQTQWTQEIRLQNSPDTGSLKWLVGAYYFNEDYDADDIYDFRADAVAMGMVPAPMKTCQLGEFDNRGYAFFGQVTYTLFDKLGLTAGLRYDREDKEMDLKTYTEMGGMPVPGTVLIMNPDEDFDEWLPKFAIDYRWTPDLMTYVSVARGHRSGGFNYFITDPADASFDAEYSWNYEVGLKSSWLDNRLILNAAAFYIDWKDQQVRQITWAMQYNTRNAGESYSQGFEIEMLARPVTGLELSAGFGYTDAKFDDYKDPLAGANYDDNRIPYVPKYTYNLSAQYRRPLTSVIDIFGRLELQGIGKSYWDEGNTQKEGAYELVNLRLGFESKHFDLYLWAKNLFDEEYCTFAFPGFFGWLGHSSDPRTVGVTLTGRF